MAKSCAEVQAGAICFKARVQSVAGLCARRCLLDQRMFIASYKTCHSTIRPLAALHDCNTKIRYDRPVLPESLTVTTHLHIMDEGLKSEMSKQGVFTTTLEELYNWGRKNSVWPLQFGLAC